MRKFIAIGAFVLLVVGLLWWRAKPRFSKEIDPAIKSANPPSLRPSKPSQPQTVFPSDSSNESDNPIETVDSPTQHRPVVARETAAQQQVDQVSFVLRDFRLALSQNPIGTNAEITAALLGNNLKQARFEIPEGSTVKDNELCDPWGTAYFFHQISHNIMEIRSAGPDRAMWTSDDLIAR
jgi:hypothetical protein